MVLKVSDNMVGKAALPIGDMIPGAPALVMIICNHCPYVLYRIPAIVNLVNEYKDRFIITAVNSNDHTRYPDDAPEMMEPTKRGWGLDCQYIYDEDQSIAKAYGAVCTAEFYVINREIQIVYHGELDPSHTSNDLPSSGSSLRHAMDLVLADKPITWDINPSFGCSVKWKE